MRQENTKKILNETREIYDRIAADFSDTRSRWWRGHGAFNRFVQPGGRVLDLGCGNGRMAEIFADSQIEYLGVDNSEELIKIARERFKDKPWAKFEVGDVRYPPPFQEGERGGFEPSSSTRDIHNHPWPLLGKEGNYDLVLLIAVLHHIPTKELRLKALQNIFASLNPGGRLAMINWNLWQIFGWKKKFRYWGYLWNWREKIKRGAYGLSDAFVPWKKSDVESMRYIHSFRLGETKRLLRQAGFEIEQLNFEVKDGQKAGWWRGENSLAIARKK